MTQPRQTEITDPDGIFRRRMAVYRLMPDIGWHVREGRYADARASARRLDELLREIEEMSGCPTTC